MFSRLPRFWMILSTQLWVACSHLPPLAIDPNADMYQGIWQSRGYGWVLQVEPRRVHFYDVAGQTCVEEDVTQSILPYLDQVTASVDGQQLSFSSTLDPFVYTFDTLTTLPPTCQTPGEAGPIETFDALAAYVAEHYAFFDLYGVDWTSHVATLRPQITPQTSEEELFQVCSDLLRPLKDAHVSLTAQVGSEEWNFEGNPGPFDRYVAEMQGEADVPPDMSAGQFKRSWWLEGIGQSLLGGKGIITAGGRIQYGIMEGRVGYLAVVTMGGFVGGAETVEGCHAELPALNQALDEAMGLFEGENVTGVILDLSLNQGGYDFIAQALANRFAQVPSVAWTKQTLDTPGSTPFEMKLTPTPLHFWGPTYMLTSRLTVSAGEATVMALRPLEHVAHVGETTRGHFSNALVKPLPNGWMVSLSNERYVDSQGQCWEGRGIPPEEALTVFESTHPLKSHVEGVLALAGRLGKAPLLPEK